MEDYEIVELIAQGGYGIVLRAMQKSTGQMVAIKQFRDSDCFTLAIAQREISVLKLMQGHPNIIKLMNSFQHNSKVFLVFELMNQNLLELLQGQPEGKLDKEQVRLFVFQMVKALAYMHSKNAVHRDIKPENMLLSRVVQTPSNLGMVGATTGQVGNSSRRLRGQSVDIVGRDVGLKQDEDQIYILKVCDLGQSRDLIDQHKADNNLTEYVSTRWYRAPELLVGSKNYDKSIDIWALGCIIPELISGNPLFPGKTNLETLAYIIRTFGNGMTEEQIQRFYENPEFQSYGKVYTISQFIQLQIPQIKNTVSLDQRVSELSPEELDFILKCLVFDPKKRLTAKQLLKHQYLNVETHIILQNYLNQVPPSQTVSDNQSISEELKAAPEQQSDIQELSHESEIDSILKGQQDLANNIKFETDNEEQMPPKNKVSKNQSKTQDSESEQNKINESLKSIKSPSQSQKIKSKKVKKRPSSSGQSNSTPMQEQKQLQNKNNAPNVSNFKDLVNFTNSIAPNPSEEYYGQESHPTENNQNEINLQQQAQEKALPKPILFLRKQKEAREHTKNNDNKLSEQKAFQDKALFESGADIPFELAQDAQNLQVFNQYSQDLQTPKNNRFSEPNPPEYRITHGATVKLKRDKINFSKDPQMIQPRREPIGLLNSQHKQSRLHENLFSNEKGKRQSLDNQDQRHQQPQQIYTISKNKVLFSNLKSNIPQGRSPPLKLNNPKLLMQNMNQIQKNQMTYQQQAYLQQALLQQNNQLQQNPKFIDVKNNQPKFRPSQMGPRNISQPPLQTNNLGNDEQFKKTNASTFGRKSTNEQVSQSKSPSQVSAQGTFNEKIIQDQLLPQINKEKFINMPIKLSNLQNSNQNKQNLLNTQKHVTNKLQLPQLNQNHYQVSASNLPNIQLSQGGDDTFRKSLSIKSMNQQQQISQATKGSQNTALGDTVAYQSSFASRLGTSNGPQQQQIFKIDSKQQTLKSNQLQQLQLPLNQVKVPSRGMVQIQNRAPSQINYGSVYNYHVSNQASQSHSPRHKNGGDPNAQTLQMNKFSKWYNNDQISNKKITQSENKRQIKLQYSAHPNVRTQNGQTDCQDEAYSSQMNYINSPPKPVSRSSLLGKQQNLQVQQQSQYVINQQVNDNFPTQVPPNHPAKMYLPRTMNKPPKR